MPFFVACSTFGALNCNIFAPSRLVFSGAREGHLPKALAIINPATFTPIPALVFLVSLNYFTPFHIRDKLQSTKNVKWIRTGPHVTRNACNQGHLHIDQLFTVC